MESKKTKNKIRIFDTTMRDGEQAPGCHMKPDQKRKMAQQLYRLGVDVIEAGFPVSSPDDFKAVQGIARTIGRKPNAPEICALARCVEADIKAAWEAVKPAHHPRIHTFFATSDIHLKHKFKISRAEGIRRAIRGVRIAKSFTDHVQFSPEDASRSNWKYLSKVIEAVIDAGATTVNIPDTVGYAIPSEFSNLITFLKKEVGNIHQAVISVHCHDDLGMAVANSLMAVKAGAQQVEGTMNGIGERAGNCSLEEVIMAIHTRPDFFGRETRINTKEIMKTSRLLSSITGMKVPPNKAIVGDNAFAHASGIHQDGFLKYSQTYEIMRPDDVGADGTWLPLTARSGRRALESKLSTMGIKIGPEKMGRAFQWFKSMADTKTIVEESDLKEITRVLI